MWLSAGVFAFAYLIGSVPFGYLAGKVNGLDVRTVGSRNIGATNILRVLGKPWGFAVFAADAIKGFVAVRLALLIVSRHVGTSTYPEFYAILAAAACVVGHAFPVWLRFKGGKGVATSAGSILGVMPVAALIMFLVWLAVFQTTRYVSLASIAGASALPFIVLVMIQLKLTHGTVLFYFSVGMTALVVWRHRSNISRLLNGTEQRFARK
jgi:acyl phosphate:glycerol-3-phosphate acyltransferase